MVQSVDSFVQCFWLRCPRCLSRLWLLCGQVPLHVPEWLARHGPLKTRHIFDLDGLELAMIRFSQSPDWMVSGLSSLTRFDLDPLFIGLKRMARLGESRIRTRLYRDYAVTVLKVTGLWNT
jgi:hypothetical protein